MSAAALTSRTPIILLSSSALCDKTTLHVVAVWAPRCALCPMSAPCPGSLRGAGQVGLVVRSLMEFLSNMPFHPFIPPSYCLLCLNERRICVTQGMRGVSLMCWCVKLREQPRVGNLPPAVDGWSFARCRRRLARSRWRLPKKQRPVVVSGCAAGALECCSLPLGRGCPPEATPHSLGVDVRSRCMCLCPSPSVHCLRHQVREPMLFKVRLAQTIILAVVTGLIFLQVLVCSGGSALFCFCVRTTTVCEAPAAVVYPLIAAGCSPTAFLPPNGRSDTLQPLLYPPMAGRLPCNHFLTPQWPVGYPPTAFFTPQWPVGYPPTAFLPPNGRSVTLQPLSYPPMAGRLPSNRFLTLQWPVGYPPTAFLPSNSRRLPSNRF